MSGSSSYTQTPNLGLYKPTPNSDTGTWGYHLNSNADTLDAMLASTGPSALFVPITGNVTMTGPLLLNASPTAAQGAATKGYVDAAVAGGITGSFLPIAGGTLTGPLILNADPAPTASLGAVTKQYADRALLSAGGTMTGPLNITATGATTSRSLQDRAAAAPDPRDFGVQFNGTDETAVFQTYLNYCQANQLAWYLPKDLVADGLTFYTSGRAADGARILATNNGQSTQVVLIAPAAADVTTVPSTEFSAWSGLFRGSAQISGLSGRRGQYITVVQNDTLIGRAGGTALNQQAGFVVWSDTGDIYPPFPDNFAWPGSGTVVTAQQTRHQIVIDNLVVELSDPPGGNIGGERNRVVQITRSNVTMRGCQVRSDSASVGIQQAFVITNASSVQLDRCVVDNIRGSGSTNYGFSGGVSVMLTYTDCQARKTRRAIDGTYVNMVRVRGGAIDSGVGAHWGHDIIVEGVTVAVDYAGGSETPFEFAGGNVRVHHCDITVTGAAQTIMSNRGDIFENYGAFELTDSNIFIDNRNNAIMASGIFRLMSITSFTPNDTTRPVVLPSLIRQTGNRVSVLGPSAMSLSLLVLLGDYTGVPQTITVDGMVIIENNQFELENGLTDSNGNPRLSITAVRPSMQIGNGYRFRMRGLPCYYNYMYANSTVVNNASRHMIHVSDVRGPVAMLQSAGVFSRVNMVNCWGSIQVAVPNPGLSYTPVGDEMIARSDDLSFAHTTYTINGTGTQDLSLYPPNSYLTVSNVINVFKTTAPGTGSGAAFQIGDTVAANNQPWVASYLVGATSGAVATFGTNFYWGSTGAGVRPNGSNNGWSFWHDCRTAGDNALTLRVFSSTGALSTPMTWNTDGSSSTLGNFTAPNVVGGARIYPTTTGNCSVTSGSAAPAATEPAGSIYLRNGGAAGARLYVSAGGGTWTAVAVV